MLFKGEQHRIERLKNEEPLESKVSVRDSVIRVMVREGKDAAVILKRWFSQKTEQYVNKIIQHYSKNFETEPARVKVKDTRRWSYCTKDRSLVFNWQLIALPPEVAEYVVLHEYAHLSKFNHQKAFYKILTRLCPKYQKREKELKKFILVERIVDEIDILT